MSIPETEQRYLPPEIIINILSRLPVRTIVSYKLCCKSWRDLLETPEFAEAHLSHSPQGLAIHESAKKKIYKIFEFNDDFDLKRHELHYNLVTDYELPIDGWICSSANGLLFFGEFWPGILFICNPLTRDYMVLKCPQGLKNVSMSDAIYGFGTSKRTNQHKLVGIFREFVFDHETHLCATTFKYEYHVYTLGTGCWRRIAPNAPFEYDSSFDGTFLNGNLHWLVIDGNVSPLISCLDLETELVSTFSPAPIPRNEEYLRGLCALGDCLCLCDNTSNVIIIWKMREYGVESSWTKEFVISKIPGFACISEYVTPIKVFKDGDILMACGVKFLFCYSHKNKTTQRIDMFHTGNHFAAVFHTPSFLSLRSFRLENVGSF